MELIDKSQYLSNVDILRDLSHEELEAIGLQTRLVEHQAGHLFYMPQDPGEVLFILKAGRVQLYRISPDGRKLIIAVLLPGAIFGQMALVGQGLHNTYAEALDDCTICVWSRENVELALRQNPRVALRFLDAVGQRLTEAENRLAEVTFKRLPARLASLLLRLIDTEGQECELRGYTHQHLADILGTYRETVTQILNEFREHGLIDTGRKCIVIQDAVGLQALVEGDWS